MKLEPAEMLYAARSLLNALLLFFYGILCRRYIQKITKWSQKHNFHQNHITIMPFFCSIILVSRLNHGAPRPVTMTKSGQQTVPPDGD
jgi:hypothetical protein